MPTISREKVERMRNMILEWFSAKYFSSSGSFLLQKLNSLKKKLNLKSWKKKLKKKVEKKKLNLVEFVSTPLRNGNSEANQMLVFWRIFSLLWKSLREKIFAQVCFPPEIFAFRSSWN